MARCEFRRSAMSWAKAVSAVSEKDFWVLKFEFNQKFLLCKNIFDLQQQLLFLENLLKISLQSICRKALKK